ncbi:hypothetical protein NQZ68_001149 [Dissostichus eleginoides]|nr:hypothetical protein NQZ68_001149 [Dissostichus eleginoides]
MFRELGSLLLLVNNYASSPVKDFIPHTALGILLLIIAVLLAYAGICRSLSHAQLFSSVCLTVSALWCGSGLVHILVGQGVLQPSELRASLVPGLAAFTLALLVIGSVAIAVKGVINIADVTAINLQLSLHHSCLSLQAIPFSKDPGVEAREPLQSLALTVLLDCTLTADSIPLHCEPDASWLFMADARVLRPLSSAHTWLLWDEVTTPILARTLQTPWKQCCFTPHRQSKYQTRITNLVYNRAGGKAPGYICQLLRLDPLHGGCLWILCFGLPAHTCASRLLSTCSALNKELLLRWTSGLNALT